MSEAEGDDSTLKKGWLEKRGEINSAWKNRYFVLKKENTYRDIPKTLWYFKDEESARMNKGGSTIQIEQSSSVERSAQGGRAHVFDVRTPARTYTLSAPSEAELMEWIEKLQAPPADDDVDDEDARERATSFTSMASFTPTGPLVEVHSGWMKKKGQGVFGSKMQKRYFVLYDNKELHYFEGASMENIQRKGRIRMAEAVSLDRLKPADRKDFSFIIKEKGRDWVLDPTTEQSWKDWEAKLRPMVLKSSK